MNCPLNWLNEYTDIKSPLNSLMWKMTEVGLTCESFLKINNETVLDIEVTPNRPDWLSITGIAREISIIENANFKYPVLTQIPTPTAKLPINIEFKTPLTVGYAGLTIANVNIKPSPKWMQERLIAVGLRPINNLVDTTNYVMFELGIPIHVFDYDKFLTNRLTMQLSKGGEVFTSVDNIKYILPSDTLVIKDKDRVIDLCGIKGGLNTGISDSTKNIFIHVPIYNGVYIRKTSQKLQLASDASYIYERGPSELMIPDALKRIVGLILKYSGGEVASKTIYEKNGSTKQKYIEIDINDINTVLGITFTQKTVTDILSKLQIKTQINNQGLLKCLVPNHRNDLKIKEDLLEEIARIYGYNKFPLTPSRHMPSINKIPYFYDRDFELKIKDHAKSLGFSEINTPALCSKETIIKSQLNLDNHIKIENPVSLEYEYMRSSIIPNLLAAIKINSKYNNLHLFEYDKIYLPPVTDAAENYKVSFISTGNDYRFIKGVLDFILNKLSISDTDINIKKVAVKKGIWHPQKAGVIEKADLEIGTIGEINPSVLSSFDISGKVMGLEINISELKQLSIPKQYRPIPKYPPQIEDIKIKLKPTDKINKIINSIKTSDSLVAEVELIDIYESHATFSIYFQSPDKTLEKNEVEKIRKKILRIFNT